MISLVGLLILSLTALGLTIWENNQPIAQTPKQTEQYRNQGIKDLEDKDYSSATDNFQKAIEDDPGNTQNYIDKSAAEYASGDNTAAIATVQEGLKQDPDNELLKSRLDVLGSSNLPDSNLDNARE